MLEFVKLTISFMLLPFELLVGKPLEYILEKWDEPGFQKFQADQLARLRRMARER